MTSHPEPLDIRHKVLIRGDDQIVINYVVSTGAIIDAALFRDGECLEVTADTDRIKQWAAEVTKK